MNDHTDIADVLQVEPAAGELSDSALDALAMLLVDFVLSEQETTPATAAVAECVTSGRDLL